MSEDKVSRLFVYGTLKQAQAHGDLLQSLALRVDPATTRGQLLDLGLFPGLVRGEGVVHGELMTFPVMHLATVLAVVDHLEGFVEGDPAASLFLREQIVAETEQGDLVDAIAYFYNQSHPDALPQEETVLLATGRWDGSSRNVLGATEGFLRFTNHVQDFQNEGQKP